MSFNSRLTATKIMGQSKAFYRQRIPIVTEESCNLSERRVDLPREKGSGTMWESPEEHLPK